MYMTSDVVSPNWNDTFTIGNRQKRYYYLSIVSVNIFGLDDHIARTHSYVGARDSDTAINVVFITIYYRTPAMIFVCVLTFIWFRSAQILLSILRLLLFAILLKKRKIGSIDMYELIALLTIFYHSKFLNPYSYRYILKS